MNKADFRDLLQSDLPQAYNLLNEYVDKDTTPEEIKIIGNKVDVLCTVLADMKNVLGSKVDVQTCITLYTKQLIDAFLQTLPDDAKSAKEKELDTLFGNLTSGRQELLELNLECNPEYAPIADNKKDDLISSHNSTNALPEELSNTITPISTTITQGVHDGDTTANMTPISTHNSSKFVDSE